VPVVAERRGALEVLRLHQFDSLGADVIVTTRHGGVSAPPYDTLNLGEHVGDDPGAVAENRCRLAAAIGVDGERLVLVRQVHGSTTVDAAGAGPTSEADAVVTTDSSLAVGVLVADCVPLVAIDADARVLGVIHAGWRGIAAGVIASALRTISSRGAVPSRLHVAMGPCIGVGAYQVGAEVAEALRQAGCGASVTPDGTGRFHADLAAACHAQLVRAGVSPARIEGPATRTDADPRLFSDRARRPCGRFALVARLTSAGS